MQDASPIVLFDGVCGLCNGVVRWLVRHDTARVLRYAPLQGTTAAALRAQHPQIPATLESIVLVDDRGIRMRSAAVVAIAGYLPYPWRLGALLGVIPAPLLDLGYRVVARVRYRIFGKHEMCALPKPEERALLLP